MEHREEEGEAVGGNNTTSEPEKKKKDERIMGGGDQVDGGKGSSSSRSGRRSSHHCHFSERSGGGGSGSCRQHRRRSRSRSGRRRRSRSSERDKDKKWRKRRTKSRHRRGRRRSSSRTSRSKGGSRSGSSSSDSLRRSNSTSSSGGSRSKSSSRYYSRRRRHRCPTAYDENSDDHDASQWNPSSKFAEHDSYKYQEPSRTIMIRGLATHLTEDDLRQDIVQSGVMVKDVRIIRHRDTGASRGFGFADFNSVSDATRWIELRKGVLVLKDMFQASLVYSVTKNPSGFPVALPTDWICEKCQSDNFKRRTHCYKCGEQKPETLAEMKMALREETSFQPTRTIILSNLDTLTTEEGVLLAFQVRPDLAAIPIKSVKIARESATSMSLGVCYVQTNTVTDGSQLHDALCAEPIDIDGRRVATSYGKMSDPASLQKNQSAAAEALAAAQWTNQQKNEGPPHAVTTTTTTCIATTTTPPPCTEVKTEEDVEKMAHYYASLYATTPEQFSSYLDYYREYYHQEMAKKGCSKQESTTTTGAGCHSSSTTTTSTSFLSIGVGGASVKDSLFPEPPRVLNLKPFSSARGNHVQIIMDLVTTMSLNQYYDKSSRCDGATATTTFDYSKLEIIPKGDPCWGNISENKDRKVDKAKKIAKEMEKWAKTQNLKRSGRLATTTPAAVSKMEERSQSSYYSSASASLSEEPFKAAESQKYNMNNDMSQGQDYVYAVSDALVPIPIYDPPAPVITDIRIQTLTRPASSSSSSHQPKLEPAESWNNSGRRGGDFSSSSKTEMLEGSKMMMMLQGECNNSFVDESKLACVLCKRRFGSKEMLLKHVQISDLHKKNLESVRRGELLPPSSSIGLSSSSSTTTSTTSTSLYRDRAKERRDLVGSSEGVVSNELKDMYIQAKEDASTDQQRKKEAEASRRIAAGIREDSNKVGNRMLQRMGWTEGQGLGKDNQGRTDIIRAERRAGKVGLGVRLPDPADGDADDDESMDRQTKVWKATLARYRDLE